MTARVVVAGGGPAGLAAAGVLARAGIDVTVLEAGEYPRTRLCGEFLSPDAQLALAALGVADLADRLDAPHIDHVRVTASAGGRVRAELRAPLPHAGRGVARRDLDAALAEAARRAGAVVRDRSRVTTVGCDDAAVVVATASGELHADALVVATGRLARPGGAGDMPSRARRWVGVKLHVAGLQLPAVTELHFVRGAYVGLNEVSCDGERRVNVCALARQERFESAGGTPDGLLAAIAAESPAFAARWRAARPIEATRAAAAGFGFARRGATALHGPRPALVCGDAAALIAPLAGDGQAMALTAGVAAGRALASRRTASGALPAPSVAGAAREFAEAFGSEMTTRLRAGRVLQSALLHPATAVALVRGTAAVRAAPSWLYRLTRGRITDRSGACTARSS